MKTCAQCSKNFEIPDSDRKFYQKMGLPDPIFCVLCRRVHMLLWRNQRVLHARKCDAAGKDIISIFAPDCGYKVYDREYWWSDAWNPLEFGIELDFNKKFSEQIDALMHRVPLAAVFNPKTENCKYVNHTGESKDCYMVFASWSCEKIMYGDLSMEDKDSMDVFGTNKISNCYEAVNLVNCYNTKFSVNSERCNDSWFVFDCKNCDSCVGCTNLRNKQNCIFNKQYSKEGYEEELKKLRLNSRTGIEEMKKKFKEMMTSAIHRYAILINCVDSTGNYLVNCKNAKYSFNIRDGVEDCSYCINGGLEMRDVWDGYGVGAKFDRGYCCFDTGVGGMENIYCGICYSNQYAYYSYNCHSNFEIFGCTGVRNKKYCILNKQYSKEEYLVLKARLIGHMKETGEWGQFLPNSTMPFGYNETLSYDYMPLTREEALRQGFKWQDKMPGTYGKETMKSADLPDAIENVPDTIVSEILACAQCNKNYKIVKQELAFYKSKSLPVPDLCSDCRYRARLLLNNPHELWHRQCVCSLAGHGHHADGAQCENKFETSYAPDRPEKVFCEQCYQKEVL